MKKRLVSVIITMCIIFTLLPCTASAKENFDSFAARICSEYDVIITCERDKSVTSEEQEQIENALNDWGKDFIRTLSRAMSKFGYEDKPVSIKIIVANYNASSDEAGKAENGRNVYLYGNTWNLVTLNHELTHIVEQVCEYACSRFNNPLADIRKEFEAAMRAANSEAISKTGDYGSKWQSEADMSYYAWTYGKTSPHEDIATLVANVVSDPERVKDLKNGKYPVMMKKLQTFRKFYEKYLTGGIVPCPIIDNILGPSDNRPTDPQGAGFKNLPKSVMNAGETFKFEVGNCYPLTAAGSFKITRLETDNSAIIRVDNETGTITAVSEGTSRIFCIMNTENGVQVSGNWDITVKGSALPTDFKFNFPTTVHVGDKFNLSVTLLPEGSVVPSQLIWGFEPYQNIITCTKDYECTAQKSGKTTITLMVDKTNIRVPVEITVLPADVTGITLNETKVTKQIGSTFQLKPTLSPNGAAGTVTYSSSDESVATVSDKGAVTAKKAGTAVITAQVGTCTATCTVTVVAPAINGIRVIPFQAVIKAGQTLQLESVLMPEGAVGDVSYTSSNPDVATVSSTGLVTGKKAGTAKITAKSGNFNAISNITVSSIEPTGITLDKTAATVEPGKTVQLKATLIPNGAAGTVSYTSSNTGVATVSSTGLVTGKKAGTATITAKAGKYSATCKVTVSSIEPTGITLDKAAATVELGKTVQLKATITPNGAAGTVSYTSSNTGVATVSSTGLVTGKKAGTATITAKVGKYSAACTVKVLGDDKNNLKEGVNILSYPAKKNYVIGEGFDKAGLNAVYYANGKQTNISDKITFYTSKTVELTQGRTFTTAGDKVVELRYDGKKVAEYTITVNEVQAKTRHPFTDVKSGAYYENPVIWSLNNGITSGTSATTFSPNDTCTRGQVVTFLWCASGSPEPKTINNPFTDVKSTDYYYKAVLWAVEKGITSGTSATTFSPNEKCTSGQVVTFLWRSNGKPQAGGTSSLAAQYSGKYYTDAAAWADSMGLLSGIDFDPDKNSPRADIVTYLYRNAGSPAV